MNSDAVALPRYRDPQRPVVDRVSDLLQRMTLDEKLAQLGSFWVYEALRDGRLSMDKAQSLMGQGIGQVTRIGGASSLRPLDSARLANDIQAFLRTHTRLGVPAIVHEEACAGYMARGATCFPQMIGVASTWDPKWVEAIGGVIRTQMRAVGAHQALSPVLDIARDPRWGRSEETFGEDPHLVGRMGCAMVRGLQSDELSRGVVATAKHFVGYGASEGGMNWAPPHIPPRELLEVYLRPFETAIRKAGLQSVMNAYHELDGVPCGASRELLTDVLRGRLGFDGLIVSDYFAVRMLFDYHHVAYSKADAARQALQAGIDIELPGTDCFGEPLRDAIQAGEVKIELVDAAVGRLLSLKFRLGLFENPFVEAERAPELFDTSEQRSVALEVARKSIVLLKNASGVLPLRRALTSIAVIGPNADRVRHQMGDYSYPAHIESLLEQMETPSLLPQTLPDRVELGDIGVEMVSVLEGIQRKTESRTRVVYARGCDVLGHDRSGFAEAVAAARAAEVAVVVVGDKAGLTDSCSSGESRDRSDLGLPGVQQELIEAIAATGTPVVLVLIVGRPVAIPWIAEHIPSILVAWLPGEEGGNAVADVLFGDVNPAGRLPMSFPRSIGQLPVYYRHKPSGGRSHWKGDYVEGSPKPLFPFGFGLSYTRFEYSALHIDPVKIDATGAVTIRVNVTNCGPIAGDEVVQLYLRDEEASVTRPMQELHGFERIHLAPGETRPVTFTVEGHSLAFYDRTMTLVTEPGPIQVQVGGSSQDIRLTGQFMIQVGEPD